MPSSMRQNISYRDTIKLNMDMIKNNLVIPTEICQKHFRTPEVRHFYNFTEADNAQCFPYGAAEKINIAKSLDSATG